MKKLTILTLMLVSSLSMAQLPSSLVAPAEKNISFDDYNGTIYENTGFANATVIDEKSSSFDAKLRYNIYDDIIEHKDGNDFSQLVKNKTVHARIGEDYYYYCDFKTTRGVRRPGYYVLVEYTENYSIYKKYNLDITDPAVRTSPLDPVVPGKIRKSEEYFLEERGVIINLPMNKKEILVSFSDKSNELEKYMKKERIKVRKEEDLIRLVSRYHALKNGDSSSQSLLSNHY